MSFYVLNIVLLGAGLGLLVLGYRRNRRNLMLVAALCLLLTGAVEDFSQGVMAGWRGSSARTL